MPAPTPTPTPQAYDPTRDAESYRSLVWEHINKRILAFLGNHHYNHEPGGKDELVFPLGGLADVALGTAIADGQALVYNAAGTCWTNGAGGGTASGGLGVGQAFFEAAGSISAGYIPGPINMLGTAVTITRVLFMADGSVAGSEALTSQAFSFTGSGSDDHADLNVAWADGARLGMNIASAGTATTYLTADVRFTTAGTA